MGRTIEKVKYFAVCLMTLGFAYMVRIVMTEAILRAEEINKE